MKLTSAVAAEIIGGDKLDVCSTSHGITERPNYRPTLDSCGAARRPRRANSPRSRPFRQAMVNIRAALERFLAALPNLSRRQTGSRSARRANTSKIPPAPGFARINTELIDDDCSLVQVNASRCSYLVL